MIRNVKGEVPQMVTANRLRDGKVVYLQADGNWSTRFANGDVAPDRDAAAKLLAKGEQAATALIVVGPYLMEVKEEDGQLQPVGYREAIRAAGPTVEEPQPA